MAHGLKLLALAGLALTIPAAAQQVRPLVGPPPAATLPAAWTAAPRVSLWPEGVLPRIAVKAARRTAPWPASFVQEVSSPYLKIFRPTASPNGRAIIVVPGGAYTFVSIANEGVDVARHFAALGYTVYVLVYRLPSEGWADRADVPLMDAQRAVRLVRSRAAADGTDPHHLAVVGFSAGGHLAATLATDFAAPLAPGRDAVDRISARPDAVGLIYPVITMAAGETNAPSREMLLGPDPDPALVDRRSAQLHVDARTPPLFLFQAIDDPAVPVENSEMMYRAMRKANRPVEAHFVQEGGHGFGLGFAGTPSGMWADLFAAWLKRVP